MEGGKGKQKERWERREGESKERIREGGKRVERKKREGEIKKPNVHEWKWNTL